MDLVRFRVQVLMGLYHRNSPYIYYHLIVRLFNFIRTLLAELAVGRR